MADMTKPWVLGWGGLFNVMPLRSPYVSNELEFRVFAGQLDKDNRQDFDTLKRMS